MCVVSMTGEFFEDRWKKVYPWVTPTSPSTVPNIIYNPSTSPSQEEFDALKREVELLKQLLIKSKEYDEKNGEKDCEIEAKMQKLREIAKIVGIDLDDVLKK